MVDVNRFKGLHFLNEYSVAKLTVAPPCIALNSSLDVALSGSPLESPWTVQAPLFSVFNHRYIFLETHVHT